MRKNYLSSNELKNRSKQNLSSLDLSKDMRKLQDSTIPSFFNESMGIYDEAESMLNIHIISKLNDNTFHLSPDENNFYYEQFEHKIKSKTVN